jgi:hypothetical protein
MEYFQVITGLTVANFNNLATTVNGNLFPKKFLRHQIIYTISDPNAITVFPGIVNEYESDPIIPPSLVYGNTYNDQPGPPGPPPPVKGNYFDSLDSLANGLNYEIVMFVRGVDPHTEKQNIEYDLSNDGDDGTYYIWLKHEIVQITDSNSPGYRETSIINETGKQDIAFDERGMAQQDDVEIFEIVGVSTNPPSGDNNIVYLGSVEVVGSDITTITLYAGRGFHEIVGDSEVINKLTVNESISCGDSLVLANDISAGGDISLGGGITLAGNISVGGVISSALTPTGGVRESLSATRMNWKVVTGILPVSLLLELDDDIDVINNGTILGFQILLKSSSALFFPPNKDSTDADGYVCHFYMSPSKPYIIIDEHGANYTALVSEYKIIVTYTYL